MSGREIIAAFRRDLCKTYKHTVWLEYTTLGAFIKLRKATINFTMCYPHETTRLTQWEDFHAVWYLGIFRKSVEKIQVSLKSDKNKGHLTWRPIHNFIISLSLLLIVRNVSDRNCRENQNTFYIQLLFFFCRNSFRLWDNVEKIQ